MWNTPRSIASVWSEIFEFWRGFGEGDARSGLWLIENEARTKTPSRMAIELFKPIITFKVL